MTETIRFSEKSESFTISTRQKPSKVYSGKFGHENLKPRMYLAVTLIHLLLVVLLPAHGGFPYRRRK